MEKAREFEQVRVHARSVESMYVVTVKVDEDRQEISLAGAGGECPASFDLLNGGALLGRECVGEIEDSADAVSLIDGVMNGAREEITYNARGTLIRSKILFNDGMKIVWGRVLFTRGRRTEVVHYLPYPRRGGGDWTYVVDKGIVDRGEATLVCQAVLDVLRPRLTKVWIDAYSDYRDELPPVVAEAQDWLRERGRARGSGDSGMGIEVDPADERSWDVLRTYASWSINVELVADENRQIASLHDCGYSVTAELTPDEAVHLTRELAVILGE